MRVASKPFNTNFTINLPDGIVVLNGDQVARIEAKKPAFNPYRPAPAEDDWITVFYLSDGGTYTVQPSDWTRSFYRETFGLG
ncbi:MAG TPA: hypothetical protein VJU84_01235 [Pyrinomonadaceae bacterium]|nr:hypothetical protein [Pyrinomonadaceae bacterium]